MAGGDKATREFDQTATWAVACVCAIIIIISIALEKVLHKAGHYFEKKHKKALFEALQIVKTELMILGFISLILTFTQYYIADICIPKKFANRMLPCKLKDESDDKESGNRRKLLMYERRILAGGKPKGCSEGDAPLISVDSLHQIHILIFFLAVFHVIFTAVTMALGKLKMRSWKEWEKETSSHEYEFSNDPSRFRLSHETSFVRAHTSFWTKIPFFSYIGCFFRQFLKSVSKSDYLTLRNGFISDHLAPGSKFNFQNYIKRSLEDDFKTVAGISPVLWASFVVYLLINVEGWKALFWASLLPVIIILLVGTKLQAILTSMAMEITERHAVVQGIPVVKVSDEYFWFGRPQLVLHLIHFILFQNAFQITYFIWIWYEFGLNSCFHEDKGFVIAKLCLGVGVLILCSYITLPLYALIAQMGSHMKKSIFDEQTSKAIKKWHNTVKKKQEGGGRSITLGDASPTASATGSPLHPAAPALQRFKTLGHSTSPLSYELHHGSEMESESPSTHEQSTNTNFMIQNDHGGTERDIEMQNHTVESTTSGDVKPSP
ncbi:hypothetical protein Leryth_006383 [Lithospermum erythrorhizon]|nr:hypothetical protein Leryth_006383 [Lithospermum erythrorhizon]